MKKKLYEILSEADNEEELKNFFAKFFKIKLATKNFIDLYTPQILFEFKFDSQIKNPQILAKIIAQTLYYVRRLKFGEDYRTVSQNICVVTKNFAAIFKTDDFSEFYSNETYDWDLAPSKPCKKLVADLSDAEIIINAKIFDFALIENDIEFATRINQILSNKKFTPKKITENNFEQIFNYWQKLFGKSVANGRKPSEYFITDIEDGKSENLRNSVLFRMTGGELVEKFIKPEQYRDFWDSYEKIFTAQEIIAIRQKMDRMTEINFRRFTGEFYTPIAFAQKAFQYLGRVVGENWFLDENFRLWDMAAGTGNLEYKFPAAALKKSYISTLLEDDVNYCKKIFPDATVFQYDFLNDDADKLPKNLRDDLNNPEIRWILFINPPYATANNYERDKSKISKDSVSMTKIREQMLAESLGQSSQELFSQFIYRISRDFAGKTAWLGMFSKIKYLNANADQKLRDKVFRYKFERGFVMNSRNFEGCTGKFPIGFIIWNLNERISIHEQEILLDIYDSDVEKIGEKIFRPARSENFLNKWAVRSRNIKKFPPMVSALTIGANHKDRNDKIPENFLAGLMVKGNDFLNQNSTALLSAPYASHAGFSITPENFEQAMIIHMVRRLPKATWLNDRDQFMQPTKKLTPEFISDAVVWSLFSPSNQTVSLRNVEYDGEIYRMQNNFYPFLLSEVRSWDCSAIEIVRQVDSATEDRFAALWLKNHEMSAESRAILDVAREIYKKFYAELRNLDVLKWKIADWDAGWYQIRMSLGATIDLSALSAKLEPQIYELGFLRDEVRYFT